jgi:hypothetical protein
MAKAETTVARAPRGTKAVSQAFFTALDVIPEASRDAVAKAAQVMIRDQIKLQRQKAKITAAKTKSFKPAAKKVAPKPAVLPAAEPAPKTTRARKTTKAPAAA